MSALPHLGNESRDVLRRKAGCTRRLNFLVPANLTVCSIFQKSRALGYIRPFRTPRNNMKATEALRERILAQVADLESIQIVVSVLDNRKTATEIRKELGLPSTTLYRKISELKECGLLMTDTFEFRHDGRREAVYACTFSEIVLRTTQKGVELEITPSKRNLEKGWFDLFFSKKSAQVLLTDLEPIPKSRVQQEQANNEKR